MIEAVGTRVRITLGNGQEEVTKQQYPSATDVVVMLNDIQGYPVNVVQRAVCGRAAADAQKSN